MNKLLAGYVELKAPGVGANAKRFKGHNLDQFKRFSAIPNLLLYTDGNEWALYRDGELVDSVVCLAGDVATDGKKAAVAPADAQAVERLLREFFLWQPIIPTDARRCGSATAGSPPSRPRFLSSRSRALKSCTLG